MKKNFPYIFHINMLSSLHLSITRVLYTDGGEAVQFHTSRMSLSLPYTLEQLLVSVAAHGSHKLKRSNPPCTDTAIKKVSPVECGLERTF